MGLLPSRGRLRFDGEDLAGLDVEARVERGLTLVPEKRELFGELSVLDNLRLGAFARRLRGAALKRRLMQSASASRASPNDARSAPAPCRAANARCSRSAAR